ncbi:PIN domain-containing protein [Croceicoccus gelatinilyticus]|uniref:PIN domain-containing protein n=1 Tax=Croceicoccus gelatinilyticus TaxID=2835536 RepID=UPI001BD1AE9E|nr:PIN domain-containing protein [Croceicoccus gelatinilyticus]MBS7668802.1 PIN domain-containing protein [Croceicoccus gelatinilyticus]
MIVTVDSAVLLHLIDPTIPARAGPDGIVPDRCSDRINHFIDQLSKQGGRVIVPTPVLAELLVKADHAGPDWLNTFKGRKAIQVADFDERAAIECAALARARSQRSRTGTRAKAKFDEQIVAIAQVHRSEIILSDDGDIEKLAPKNMKVRGVSSLELPPQAAQSELFDDEA